MKLFSTSVITLITLVTPALADAPPPASVRIQFTLRDTTTTRRFDVVVNGDNPCATANDKRGDSEVALKACVLRGTHLDLSWRTRGAWGEYDSTSSIPVVRGSTVALGTAKGPQLVVAIQ